MKPISNSKKSVSRQRQIHFDPVRLAESVIGHRCHICAFFHDKEEANRILLPFIREAFDQGQKVVHTVDPRKHSEQLQLLESVGIVAPLGKITEEHFDKIFNINVRGTLFTVQKALPLLNDGGSIILTGSVAS